MLQAINEFSHFAEYLKLTGIHAVLAAAASHEIREMSKYSGQCPGVAGHFWHVTDFHYDFSYWTSQMSCNAEVTQPAPFGDYWCDSPWRLVTTAVQAMAEHQPDVDFLLWTG